MRKKRKDFEIRFYESLIEKQPDFVQALSVLGDAYTRKGFYNEGKAIDLHLAELRPQDPIVHYNLACSLALLGQIKPAIDELKKAVLLGYEDIEYMIKDPDLKTLRQSEEFKIFYSKIQQKHSAPGTEQKNPHE